MVLTFIFIIILSLLVGWLGSNRKFGFWGYFLLSLLFTPLIGVIVVLASDSRPVLEARAGTSSNVDI
ncbi:MAG TPA: hypothetical protein VEO54_01745 [Thermoanaerobaculia bacterium]|nr:hypothetical protein [Thermoanaerobaculia bacterium]